MTRIVRASAFAALVVFAAGMMSPPALAAEAFPDRIDLPTGFQPEGIAIGEGDAFYVGSIPTGTVYTGSLRSGERRVLTVGEDGDASIGLAVHPSGLIFVAGGSTGRARVIDADSGDVVRPYTLVTGSSFVNDVVATRSAAYFTDSVNPVLYRVPIDLGPATTIPLGGDLQYQSGFNVNGIDATPDGSTLVLVQSNTGKLFTADPATGATSEIDLGDARVPNGDGILLDGTTLYVVQNRLNVIATIRLAPDLSSGVVVERRTAAGFDVPTTIDRFGSHLYAVNARFGTPSPGSADYWITRIGT